MSKGKHDFKETTVSRLIRVAQKNNLRDFTIRITPDALELRSGQPANDDATEDGRPNSFDQVLGPN